MRKFRAWDTNKKCWADPTILGIRLDGIMIDMDEGFLQHNPTDLILMQFTGLKDKNGKEEYHKDIVKHDSGVLGVIEWDNNREAWCYKWQDGKTTYPRIMHDFVDEVVIGNIHENPELLGGD